MSARAMDMWLEIAKVNSVLTANRLYICFQNILGNHQGKMSSPPMVRSRLFMLKYLLLTPEQTIYSFCLHLVALLIILHTVNGGHLWVRILFVLYNNYLQWRRQWWWCCLHLIGDTGWVLIFQKKSAWWMVRAGTEHVPTCLDLSPLAL